MKAIRTICVFKDGSRIDGVYVGKKALTIAQIGARRNFHDGLMRGLRTKHGDAKASYYMIEFDANPVLGIFP